MRFKLIISARRSARDRSPGRQRKGPARQSTRSSTAMGRADLLFGGGSGCTYTLERSVSGSGTWTTLSTNATSPYRDCPPAGSCYDYRVKCNNCSWWYFDGSCCV
jgi:hypothetical protein